MAFYDLLKNIIEKLNKTITTEPQTNLSEVQKEQARKNIDAAGKTIIVTTNDDETHASHSSSEIIELISKGHNVVLWTYGIQFNFLAGSSELVLFSNSMPSSAIEESSIKGDINIIISIDSNKILNYLNNITGFNYIPISSDLNSPLSISDIVASSEAGAFPLVIYKNILFYPVSFQENELIFSTFVEGKEIALVIDQSDNVTEYETSFVEAEDFENLIEDLGYVDMLLPKIIFAEDYYINGISLNDILLFLLQESIGNNGSLAQMPASFPEELIEDFGVSPTNAILIMKYNSDRTLMPTTSIVLNNDFSIQQFASQGILNFSGTLYQSKFLWDGDNISLSVKPLDEEEDFGITVEDIDEICGQTIYYSSEVDL